MNSQSRAGLITVAAAAALLATACGSSPSSTQSDGSPNTGGAANSTTAVAYSRCVRAHGLPKFPDPTNDNGRVEFVISVGQDGFDPHSPQILAKARSCQHVLPAGSNLPSVTVTS